MLSKRESTDMRDFRSRITKSSKRKFRVLTSTWGRFFEIISRLTTAWRASIRAGVRAALECAS